MQSLLNTLRRDRARWWAYALILLVPGSFIVLPVIWAVRLWRTRSWTQAAQAWARTPEYRPAPVRADPS